MKLYSKQPPQHHHPIATTIYFLVTGLWVSYDLLVLCRTPLGLVSGCRLDSGLLHEGRIPRQPDGYLGLA